MQKQIKLLKRHSKSKKLYIYCNIMDVQKQRGSSDCGLFAKATATPLAHRIIPKTCWFEQGKMRQHVLECLE